MSSARGTNVPNAGWELGIDFGTSYTVAAVAASSGVAVLDIESNGQSRMPSCVFYTEAGEILVGTAAQHQSAFAPERYEATPKRSIADGQIFLGDEMVDVTSLIAGVFRVVYTEARRRQGETPPRAIRLTHPAEWGQARLDLLREAAARADLPAVELVPEPVAAAVWIAGAVTEPGERIAVYDFGGGTFDAAVLRRTSRGFEVAGPPAGRDPLGGEDIDRSIVDYIGTVVNASGGDANTSEEWAQLTNPQDVTWRRRSIALRMEVQRVKETLSEVSACQMWIPGLERELQLTRPELESLISDDLDECTQTLLTAMADASVTPEQLSGVYLVGGSSRIPAVADKLWQRLGIAPSVQDSPKSVVALGAARWTEVEDRVASPLPVPERTVITKIDPVPPLRIVQTGDDGGDVVSPSLMVTLPTDMSAWRAGVRTSQTLERVRGGPPSTIRLRDEPSGGVDVAELAAEVGRFRASRSPEFVDYGLRSQNVLGASGLERSFAISPQDRPVEMLERYAIEGDRALVLAAPRDQIQLVDAIRPLEWPARTSITAPAVLPVPPGWATSEQVDIIGPDGARIVRAQRVELPDEPEEAWRWHRLEAQLQDLPAAGIGGRVGGRMLGALPCEIVTVRWQAPTGSMITKFGTATAHGHGFILELTLPVARWADFGAFSRLVRLRDAAPRSR